MIILLFVKEIIKNIKEQEVIIEKVQDLIENNKIQESQSPWNSPIILVPKKGGKTRMCIDYRLLNERTITESCPPPSVTECLDNLGGCKYFSTLDLDSGYHQIPLNPDSTKYTAFTTPIGKFEYKYLPFGLKNAPSHFQTMMYVVLQKLVGKKVVVYMDDIIVYSSSLSAHYEDLKEVLKLLASYKLYINYQKCKFISSKVDFLGFEISENKIKPSSEKQDIFKRIGEIDNIKKLHSIVGLINYYRNFIDKYSEKTKQLYSMINKKQAFDSKLAKDIVENLVSNLQGEIYLEIPNLEEKFIIESDASEIGIGGILKQFYNGKERIVRHVSRMLKPAEKNYATVEKELLAVVYCISELKHYLGGEFILRSDHKPLEYIRKMKDPR